MGDPRVGACPDGIGERVEQVEPEMEEQVRVARGEPGGQVARHQLTAARTGAGRAEDCDVTRPAIYAPCARGLACRR
jgi:hypothetical protein